MTVSYSSSVVLVPALCLAFMLAPASSGLAAKGADQHKMISASEAAKIAENRGRILSLHLRQHPTKKFHYYVITILDSTRDEIEDLFVDARDGTVRQVYEHPSSMGQGEGAAR